MYHLDYSLYVHDASQRQEQAARARLARQARQARLAQRARSADRPRRQLRLLPVLRSGRTRLRALSRRPLPS